jgi:hypothetical protein
MQITYFDTSIFTDPLITVLMLKAELLQQVLGILSEIVKGFKILILKII